MKKYTTALAAVLLCTLLTGCCLSHEWQEATCTAPKTCAKCGETEGEALAHNWLDAACAAPKTCSVCGATEGEALPHDLTEANYQQPATCKVCEATVGEPLPAAFETLDIKGKWIEDRKTYDYVTTCYDNHDVKTTGKLRVFYYPDIRGEEFEEKDGYVWQHAQVTISFSDENARKYGMQIGDGSWDYYSGFDPIDTKSEVQLQIDEDGTITGDLEWKGIIYPECKVKYVAGNSGWKNGIWTWHGDFFYRVPVGYDGVVLLFRNSSIAWEDGKYINEVMDENTLMFRLYSLQE